MIDVALKAIASRLNTHIRNKLSITKDKVVLSTVVRNDDTNTAGGNDKITLSLVNITQEKNIKNLPVNPADSPIFLNMSILLAVYFGEDGSYEQALKELSTIISFFQANPVFTPQNTPDLDSSVEKLHFILEDSDLQKDQNLWTMLGGRHTPSVIYRVNMIALQEDKVSFGGTIGR